MKCNRCEEKIKLVSHFYLVLSNVLTGSTKSEEEIKSEVIKCVRNEIGPVAAFRLVVLVPKLPKTRSGKVARNTIAALAAGKPFKVGVTFTLFEDKILCCFILKLNSCSLQKLAIWCLSQEHAYFFF